MPPQVIVVHCRVRLRDEHADIEADQRVAFVPEQCVQPRVCYLTRSRQERAKIQGHGSNHTKAKGEEVKTIPTWMMPALLMTTTASRLSSTDNSSAAPSAISDPSPLTPARSAAAACAQPRMRATEE